MCLYYYQFWACGHPNYNLPLTTLWCREFSERVAFHDHYWYRRGVDPATKPIQACPVSCRVLEPEGPFNDDKCWLCEAASTTHPYHFEIGKPCPHLVPLSSALLDRERVPTFFESMSFESLVDVPLV